MTLDEMIAKATENAEVVGCMTFVCDDQQITLVSLQEMAGALMTSPMRVAVEVGPAATFGKQLRVQVTGKGKRIAQWLVRAKGVPGLPGSLRNGAALWWDAD